MNEDTVSASTGSKQQKKMALLSLFDHLYCQEENLELEQEEDDQVQPTLPIPQADCHVVEVAEEDWPEVLCSLAAKEGEALPELAPDGGSGSGSSYLRLVRKQAVEWIARAAARHAFSALTALLAVNYLDRCFLPSAAAGGLRLQDDKPWMGRLAAVACLSLAAKVEETRVPLLLDLQVPAPHEAAVAEEDEDGGYLFEPRTIRRMELLVLSALGWRMNPVTPLSFIHHVLPRLRSKDEKANTDSTAAGIAARIRELVRRSEAVLLSVIADWRWVRYPPSVWAAAALIQASESGEGGGSAMESQEIDNLVSLLNAPKEQVEESYRLMMDEVGNGINIGHKRKHSSYSPFHYNSSPLSPVGVVDSCFSCVSSCDSWAMWPSPSCKRLNVAMNKSSLGDNGVVEEGVGYVPV